MHGLRRFLHTKRVNKLMRTRIEQDIDFPTQLVLNAVRISTQQQLRNPFLLSITKAKAADCDDDDFATQTLYNYSRCSAIVTLIDYYWQQSKKQPQLAILAAKS